MRHFPWLYYVKLTIFFLDFSYVLCSCQWYRLLPSKLPLQQRILASESNADITDRDFSLVFLVRAFFIIGTHIIWRKRIRYDVIHWQIIVAFSFMENFTQNLGNMCELCHGGLFPLVAYFCVPIVSTQENIILLLLIFRTKFIKWLIILEIVWFILLQLHLPSR